MNVTIAICTWNRAELLDLTLAEIRKFKIPDGLGWELLVVNNNCSDETESVIARHAEVLPITRVFEGQPGVAHARNCALTHAKSDWIIWIDDDVLVDPDWLLAFSRTVTQYPDAAVIGGPIAPWFPFEPDPDLFAAFAPLQRGFCGLDYGPEHQSLDNKGLYCANMAVHLARTAGLKFDTDCGRVQNFQGGEEDLNFVRAVRARGERVIWSPKMRVRHYVDPKRMTVEYMDRWFNDLGEWTVRREGVPEGAQLFGVPRWLLRRYLTSAASAIGARLTFRRVAYLKARQEWSHARGTLRECRVVRQKRAS
jgi:glycosyltransferase involved in cell wall biosynthesis